MSCESEGLGVRDELGVTGEVERCESDGRDAADAYVATDLQLGEPGDRLEIPKDLLDSHTDARAD